MKFQEIRDANDMLDKYHKLKVEIEKASCLCSVTLFYNGHHSHDMRGEEIEGVRVALIRGFEKHACSLLTQLVIVGIDIDHERVFLQTLVAKALKGPINHEAPPRRGEPV